MYHDATPLHQILWIISIQGLSIFFFLMTVLNIEEMVFFGGSTLKSIFPLSDTFLKEEMMFSTINFLTKHLFSTCPQPYITSMSEVQNEVIEKVFLLKKKCLVLKNSFHFTYAIFHFLCKSILCKLLLWQF